MLTIVHVTCKIQAKKKYSSQIDVILLMQLLPSDRLSLASDTFSKQ